MEFISEDLQEKLVELQAQEVLAKKYRLDELNQLICSCEDIVEEFISDNDIKTANDNNNYLLNALGKSFVSMREIIALCKAGFPDGALSIARNIYEQFVITVFIVSKVDESDFAALLERYSDDFDIQRAKALKYEAEFISKNNAERDKQKNTIDSIKQKHGLTKSLRDYWWSLEGNCDFHSLCEYAAAELNKMELLVRNMNLMYRRACISLHASNIGNKLRLGSNSGAIEMGPWIKGQEAALFLATASLLYILLGAFNSWKIDAKETIEKVEDLTIFYDGIMRKKG